MTIQVTCAIIKKDNKILLAQRSEKMSLPLKWEFPGGKIEENETAENCLTREILEELNIEIKIISRLPENTHTYSDKSITLIPFVCKYLSGTLELKEHKTALWLDKKDLLLHDLADADIPIANHYLNLP